MNTVHVCELLAKQGLDKLCSIFKRLYKNWSVFNVCVRIYGFNCRPLFRFLLSVELEQPLNRERKDTVK